MDLAPYHHSLARLAAEAAPGPDAKLAPFLINIGQRGAPRLSFGAMAVDACAAHQQHVDLAEPGERVEVVPLNAGEAFPIRVVRHELEEAQLRTAISEGEAMLAESECSGMTPCPPESPTAYAQRRARENDQRAMDAQLQQPASWGFHG